MQKPTQQLGPVAAPSSGSAVYNPDNPHSDVQQRELSTVSSDEMKPKERWLAYKHAAGLAADQKVAVDHLAQYAAYLLSIDCVKPHAAVRAAGAYELERACLVDPSGGMGEFCLKQLVARVKRSCKRPATRAPVLTEAVYNDVMDVESRALLAVLAQLGRRTVDIAQVRPSDVTFVSNANANGRPVCKIYMPSGPSWDENPLPTVISCHCRVEYAAMEPDCPVCGRWVEQMFPLTMPALERVTSMIGMRPNSFRRTVAVSVYMQPWATKIPLFNINRHVGLPDSSDAVVRYCEDAERWRGTVMDVSRPVWRSIRDKNIYGYGQVGIPAVPQHVATLFLDPDSIRERASLVHAYAVCASKGPNRDAPVVVPHAGPKTVAAEDVCMREIASTLAVAGPVAEVSSSSSHAPPPLAPNQMDMAFHRKLLEALAEDRRRGLVR